MTIEMAQLLSMVSYSLAAIFLILAVVFFLMFDVRKIFSNLSGRTAKRGIEDIKQRNFATANIKFAGLTPKEKSQTRNTKTSKSKKFVTIEENPVVQSPITQRPTAQKPVEITDDRTTKLNNENVEGSADTTVLQNTQAQETTNLQNSQIAETSVLSPPPIGETSVLNSPAIGETSVLSDYKPSSNFKFNVDVEISFLASNEIII